MDNNELIKSGFEAFTNDDDFRHWAGQFINQKPWVHNTEYVYKWFGSTQVVDGVKCSKCNKELNSINDVEGCTVSSPIQGSLEVAAFELRNKFKRYEWEIACGELYCYLKRNEQIPEDCQSLSHWMMSYVFNPMTWILISCLILNEEQYVNDILDNKAPDPVHYFEGKWWFWDETWSERIGPYWTIGIANDALKDYCKSLHESENDEKVS
jgi:hypothetical protein